MWYRLQKKHLIRIALKRSEIIIPDVDEDRLAERFLRKQVQARLSLTNIASVNQCVRFENQFLMVMEYVDGVTCMRGWAGRYKRRPKAWQSSYRSQSALDRTTGACAGCEHRDNQACQTFACSPAAKRGKLMDVDARSLTDTHWTRTGEAGDGILQSPEAGERREVEGRSDMYFGWRSG